MRYRYNLLLLIVWPGTFIAQDCMQSAAFETFHANDIRTIVSNGGDLFWNLEDNTFQAPFTNPESPHLIFAAGIWLAGFDPAGNLKVAAQQYRYNKRNDYVPGPLDTLGQTDLSTCRTWDRIWMVNRHNIQQHLADWADDGVIAEPISSIYQWPGKGNAYFAEWNGFELPEREHFSAPFHDGNMNGIYEPDLGEYPLPRNVDPGAFPMLMTWSVFNDQANHTNSYGDPLQSEVQLTTYAFHCTDNPLLNGSVFTDYRIVNRSQARLDSVVFGQWLDPDLGCYTDDFMGSYPSGSAIFVYNQDPVDGEIDSLCPLGISTFGSAPPVLAVTYLDRQLNAMTYYHTGGLWDGPVAMTEPQLPVEFYYYMTGRWRDGIPLTRGGLGYQVAPGEITSFAFPDDPRDPDGWSMYTLDLSGDRRIVGSADLGSLGPGERADVALAFSFHRTSGFDHIGNVGTMYTAVEQLAEGFEAGFSGLCSYDSAICIDDCVYPGDTDHDGRVTMADFLNIGVAFSDTGAPRSGPIAWIPQSAADWSGSSVASVNSKHADCNGDGMIDAQDFAIAEMNFGLRNPYAASPSVPSYSGDLSIIPESDSIMRGQIAFNADVVFRNADVDSLYGLAFSVVYDSTYFRIAVAHDHTSILQDTTEYAALRQVDNSFAVVNVSIDGRNKAVQPRGLMELTLFLDNNAPLDGSDTAFFEIHDVRAVLSDGSVLPIAGDRIPVIIYDEVLATREIPHQQFNVYPNPSGGAVMFDLAGSGNTHYRVHNLQGQLTDEGITNDGRASLRLPDGLYMLTIEDDGVLYHAKVVISN